MGYKSVTHVNTQFVAGTANTDTLVITKPVGLAVGHLMLAFFLTAVDAVTAPGGWTQYDTDDSTNMRSVVFTKIAVAGDVSATSFTFTAATAAGPFCGGISAYSNVDTSNPVNIANQGVLNTSTNPVTTPSVTTTQADLLVHYLAVRIGSTTIPTSTGSGNERANFGNHGTSTTYQMAWYDSGTTVVAGSQSGIAITSSGTVTQSIARTVAIQAASLDQPDTGSASEGTPSIAFSASDTGTATETQAVSVGVSGTDLGSRTEAQTIGLTGADTGTRTETSTIAATFLNSDIGSGVDSQSISITRSDTGSASETQSILSVSDWTPPVSGTTPGSNLLQTLIMGPASIYIGNYGATEPADTLIGSVPSSSDWTDLGATLGGVTMTVKQEYERLDLMQIPDRVASRLKKRDLQAHTELAEPTLANFLFLLNEGTVASGAGYQSFTPSATFDKATPPTYRAVIIDGWAPDFTLSGRHKRRRIIMRKCLSIEGTVSEYKSDKQTAQSVTWSAHRVDGTIAPFKIIDEV